MEVVSTYYAAYVGDNLPLYEHPANGHPRVVQPWTATSYQLDIIENGRDFKGEPDTWMCDPEVHQKLKGADGSDLWIRFVSHPEGGWRWGVQSTKP